MDEITKSLANTFGGQAANQADTFAGKMARLQVAFNEGKETIGSFVLDAITPMIDTVVNVVIPAVSQFIDSIGGKEGITSAFMGFVDGAKKLFIPIFEGIKFAFDKIKDAVMGNKEEFAETLAARQEAIAITAAAGKAITDYDKQQLAERSKNRKNG